MESVQTAEHPQSMVWHNMDVITLQKYVGLVVAVDVMRVAKIQQPDA